MFCIKSSFFRNTQSFYWTQLCLYCHLARTWLIAFLYSRIAWVEAKYNICVIFIDVSICAKEERESSVQRLYEQECIAYSGCTCRTYGNWTVWAGVEWVSWLGVESGEMLASLEGWANHPHGRVALNPAHFCYLVRVKRLSEPNFRFSCKRFVMFFKEMQETLALPG